MPALGLRAAGACELDFTRCKRTRIPVPPQWHAQQPRLHALQLRRLAQESV